MMPVRADDDTYGTIDLAEATVLVSQGFERYELTKLSRSQASWTFFVPEDPIEEDRFWAAIDEYAEGKCRVEPRSFMIEVRTLRSELYKFLGPNAPKRPETEEAASV